MSQDKPLFLTEASINSAVEKIKEKRWSVDEIIDSFNHKMQICLALSPGTPSGVFNILIYRTSILSRIEYKGPDLKYENKTCLDYFFHETLLKRLERLERGEDINLSNETYSKLNEGIQEGRNNEKLILFCAMLDISPRLPPARDRILHFIFLEKEIKDNIKEAIERCPNDSVYNFAHALIEHIYSGQVFTLNGLATLEQLHIRSIIQQDMDIEEDDTEVPEEELSSWQESATDDQGEPHDETSAALGGVTNHLPDDSVQ